MQAAQASLTISNAGDAALTVSALTFGGANGTEFTSGQTLPFDVPAGGSKAIPIGFTPAASGARSGAVTLTSTAFKMATLDVALAGGGTTPPPVAPDAGSSSGGTSDGGSSSGRSSSEGSSGTPAATPEDPEASSDGGGCGCRTVPTSTSSVLGGGLLLGAAMLFVRRHRSRQGRDRSR